MVSGHSATRGPQRYVRQLYAPHAIVCCARLRAHLSILISRVFLPRVSARVRRSSARLQAEALLSVAVAQYTGSETDGGPGTSGVATTHTHGHHRIMRLHRMQCTQRRSVRQRECSPIIIRESSYIHGTDAKRRPAPSRRSLERNTSRLRTARRIGRVMLDPRGIYMNHFGAYREFARAHARPSRFAKLSWNRVCVCVLRRAARRAFSRVCV